MAGTRSSEELVEFDRELSLLAVRGHRGETVFYPLVENVHEGGILRSSRAPAADAPQAEAEDYATRLLDELGYVGVLALELFDVGDRLLANELAPRVHNSGHWTIEGAATSQFENHLRAILGWPLGSTTMHGEAVLLNVIGAEPDPAAVLAVPGAHLHLYGKEPRPGRKLGHITLLDPTPSGSKRHWTRWETAPLGLRAMSVRDSGCSSCAKFSGVSRRGRRCDSRTRGRSASAASTRGRAS